MPSQVQYRLAYLPVEQRACAQGEPRLLSSLLPFPGVRRHGDLANGGYLSLPLSREAVLALDALASPTAVSEAYRQARAQVLTVDTAEVERLLEPLLERPLLPHQLQFCAQAYPLVGAYQASEQGTGKTATAWAMTALWGCQRTLVVTGKSLAQQWEEEAVATLSPRACPGLQLLIEGRLADRTAALQDMHGYDFPTAAVINYEALVDLLPAVLAYGPKLVVFDEAWRLKNPRAKVTRAATRLVQAGPLRCLLLAGTPIGNDVGDLFSQLRLLLPDQLGTWSHLQFLQRYCRLIPIGTGGGRPILKPVGCSDPAGLTQLMGPVWHRTLKEVCQGLPEKRFHTVLLDLPPDLRRLYDQVLKEGEAALGHELSLADERVVMVRLQQLCGGHRPVMGEAHLDQLEPIEGHPKVEWVLRWAHEVLEQDPTHRAIIWCRFNAEVELLTELLAKTPVESVPVTGETKEKALQAWKAEFNSRHESGVQVLVAQVAKLCAGHNLQAADTHVYFSNSWSYLQRAQSEDRSARLGRHTPVDFVDLVCRQTIDEAILRALRGKESLAERLAVATVGLGPLDPANDPQVPERDTITSGPMSPLSLGSVPRPLSRRP